MADTDWEDICEVIVMGAGGVGAVVLTPALLAWLGFTAAGVAAGSIAAKMIAYFTAVNGGAMVAWLLSLGAGGLTWGESMLGSSFVGAIVGWIMSNVCKHTVGSAEAAGGPHTMPQETLQWPSDGCVKYRGRFYCT